MNPREFLLQELPYLTRKQRERYEGVIERYMELKDKQAVVPVVKLGVLEAAAQIQETTVEAILSRSRKQPIAFARHMIAFTMRTHGATFTSIGRRLGGRDHSTIINSYQEHRSLFQMNREYRDKYNEMLNLI